MPSRGTAALSAMALRTTAQRPAARQVSAAAQGDALQLRSQLLLGPPAASTARLEPLLCTTIGQTTRMFPRRGSVSGVATQTAPIPPCFEWWRR
jgi:hypothetical protein